MTGLSKITDKILDEARNDAAERLKAADREAADIRAEYARRAAEIRAAIAEKAKQEAAGIVSRAKSGENMARRNAALAAKSAMLDRAYGQAKAKLLAQPAEQYAAFLTMLLTSAVRKRAESEKISREVYETEEETAVYELRMNSRDSKAYAASVLAAVKKAAATPEERCIAEKLTLCPEAAPIEGGLILRCDDISINCSVEALFEGVRPVTERDISRILFPVKKG